MPIPSAHAGDDSQREFDDVARSRSFSRTTLELACHAKLRRACNSKGPTVAALERQQVSLCEYLDNIAIFDLPERRDRFKSLSNELRSMGVDVRPLKVLIPSAPRPEDAIGLSSRSVGGNFLSHHEILGRAWQVVYKANGCSKER